MHGGGRQWAKTLARQINHSPKNMNAKPLIAFALALPLLAQAAPLTNLVVNGGFEANPVNAGNWIVYGSPTAGSNRSTTALTGWTVDSGFGVEVRNNVAGQAFEGTRYVELDSFGDTSMSQWIDTVAGGVYELSFAYSPRERVSSASNGIQVWWNQELLSSLTAPGKASGHDWQTFSFTVTGTGGLDRLRFNSMADADTLGGSLDNVVLAQAVPEPASFALAGLSLLALGLTARRRRA
jgi:hypothetical protein